MGTYCVYKHTAPNQKVYIGITSRDPEIRWRKDGSGYTTSPHFYSAIKKYGWENFGHEIIFTGLTKEEACLKEKELIAKYNSADREYGYNSTYGGETGMKYTEETREKISESNKRWFSNPEIRKQISERLKGIKRSEETKAKLRIAFKDRKRTWKMSDEAKKLVGEKNRKRYTSPETRWKYQRHFDELAAYGIKRSIAVNQIDDDGNIIATYPSMKAAYRATGIGDGNISKCCHGKVKHAGGYIWRFAS